MKGCLAFFGLLVLFAPLIGGAAHLITMTAGLQFVEAVKGVSLMTLLLIGWSLLTEWWGGR